MAPSNEDRAQQATFSRKELAEHAGVTPTGWRNAAVKAVERPSRAEPTVSRAPPPVGCACTGRRTSRGSPSRDASLSASPTSGDKARSARPVPAIIVAVDTEESHYCKLFVDGAAPDLLVLLAVEALNLPSSAVDGSRVNRFVRFGEIEIEPRDNPDRGPAPPDAPWLTWPSIIAVEAPRHVTEDELVNVVGSLLTALWEQKFGAVAAADFEERLPRRGGWHGGSFVEV